MAESCGPRRTAGHYFNVDSESASYGNQRLARIHAANYFALFESLRSPAETETAWEIAVGGGLDVSRPLAAGSAGSFGRLDLDDAALLKAYAAVAAGSAHLRPDDVILELGFPGYPARLAATEDAPRFLFVRQQENVLEIPSLSVVGTREATVEGRSRARRLANLLVRRGIAVCSGLAHGIDEAAHLGALEAGGTTIAVIGTPLTRSYPKEHAPLQDRIGFLGAVVSQFHPASKTLPLCFPLRNATMSGLSLGTVVIEASETSGALIQARKALQQGRKVFIPCSAVENDRLRWPARLIEKGAHVFKTIEELLGVLESEHLVPPRELVASTATVAGLHAS